jgi:hypothetical protein
LHWHLANLDLTGFNPNARAPMTQTKQEMIELSRNEVERWLYELPDTTSTTLFTMNDLLNRLHEHDERCKAGFKAIQKALKGLHHKQAHGGKQVRVFGRPKCLWVVARPEEAERLHAIQEPSELAAEYERQHPEWSVGRE